MKKGFLSPAETLLARDGFLLTFGLPVPVAVDTGLVSESSCEVISRQVGKMVGKDVCK